MWQVSYMRKDDKKKYLILKDRNIYKGLIILAIPLMLNNLLKSLHDIVDMIFVGRIPDVGTQSVAAIQLTFPIMFTFLSLGMGMSVAGTALISQFLGMGHRREARRYASQLLVLAGLLGVILNIVSYTAAPMIIRSMGVDPLASAADAYIFESSTQYLRIRAFELPFLFLFFSLLAVRQAGGDTTTPVLVSGTAIITNIFLSYIFIRVLNLGVPGAAYATLVANVLIMPAGLYLLFFAKSGITVSVADMRLQKGVVKDIVRTAVPASMGQAITAIGFYLMNGIIYSYGPETVAAFGVGNRIMSMILHPVMAMGGVLSAYIGQNIGAHNPDRARLTFRKAMLLSSGTMAVGAGIIMIFRGFLAGLFIVDDPVALALAVEYMFYILLGLPLMAVFQTFMGTYNGTGFTQFSFILSVSRLWGMRIPLVIAFREWTALGSSGIWYAMLISNFVAAFLGWMLYKRLTFEPKVRLEEPITKHVELKTT